jgi:hypothetical protein
MFSANLVTADKKPRIYLLTEQINVEQKITPPFGRVYKLKIKRKKKKLTDTGFLAFALVFVWIFGRLFQYDIGLYDC